MITTKYEMVTAILEMYDTMQSQSQQLNESARQIADLRRQLQECRTGSTELVSGGCEILEAKVIEAGRKKVYDEHVFNWRTVDLKKNEETGVYEPTPFEKWRRDSVHDIPNDVCMADFYDYFNIEFRADYEREVQRAMEKQIARDRDVEEDY